jgi:adenine-specific DNA methylase
MGDCIEKAFAELASTHAREKGQASVADANLAAESVREGDLVFIDPPYSGVHYSRFYHVFESIAHGNPGDVSGVGRYPDSEKRPFSRYSVKRGSKDALDDLFMKIAERKAKAILTFPRHACSNGLSGRAVKAKARRYFAVKEKQVESKFSTLGGTKVGKEIGNGRGARKKAYELILLLDPQ